MQRHRFTLPSAGYYTSWKDYLRWESSRDCGNKLRRHRVFYIYQFVDHNITNFIPARVRRCAHV